MYTHIYSNQVTTVHVKVFSNYLRKLISLSKMVSLKHLNVLIEGHRLPIFSRH